MEITSQRPIHLDFELLENKQASMALGTGISLKDPIRSQSEAIVLLQHPLCQLCYARGQQNFIDTVS